MDGPTKRRFRLASWEEKILDTREYKCGRHLKTTKQKEKYNFCGPKGFRTIEITAEDMNYCNCGINIVIHFKYTS